jgi:hypothetical protein
MGGRSPELRHTAELRGHAQPARQSAFEEIADPSFGFCVVVGIAASVPSIVCQKYAHKFAVAR